MDFLKKYTRDEIETILKECRFQIEKMVQSKSQRPCEIMVFIPDYFTKLLNTYFKQTYGNSNVGEIVFGDGSTFYGVKNFYPSPINEIIISCRENPNLYEDLNFNITLKPAK